MTNTNATSYDELPYRTFAVRTAHPSRLAALARLYGIDAPLPNTCSVLEIGCGSGGNLIHLGYLYPESTFVGVDLSPRHISQAKEAALGSEVSNVEFVLGDFATSLKGREAFDYIICHGVYSWIKDESRVQLLEVIKRLLAKDGVAFVSYNVLPGWRQRGALRDIMMTGAALGRIGGEVRDPATSLERGMELLKLVGSIRKREGDPLGAFVREAIVRMEESDPSYIFHEYLEEHNEPVLFSKFMSTASSHGLQFLSEAKPALMSCDDLGPEVAKYLSRYGSDIIAQEQALDMLRNRMFRETILCHDNHNLRRDLKASVFKTLQFVSDYRPTSNKSATTNFRDVVSGREVETPNDEHTQILRYIASKGFGGASFAELRESDAAKNVGERECMHAVVRLWRAGFVDCVCDAPRVVRLATGTPQISPVARYQAKTGDLVTALQHRSFALSGLEQRILRAVDGETSFDEIVKGVTGDPAEGMQAVERLIELGFFF